MNKFEELYEEITKMLYWAEDQRHINWEQRDLLVDKIYEIKKDIESKEN